MGPSVASKEPGSPSPSPNTERRCLRAERQENESLKDVTGAFVMRTKVHGLRYLFSRDKSRAQRLLWLLAIFICLGLLFTWSWNRVLYLLSFPAVTKIHMVWAYNMTFPAVTLCNQNLFRVSGLTRADLYHSGYWMDIMHQNHTVNRRSLALLRHSVHRERLLRLLDFSDYAPPAGPDTAEMVGRLGHQLEDMLLECRFQGQNCTARNFTPIYTRYGKCYTFNSGLDGNPLLTTLKGGTGNGLEIMLDIQQDEYLPVWGETDETSYEAGIKVQIHSQDEPPFIDQLGFGVAPGFQTFVSCQQQLLQYLPPPWGDCKSTPIDSEFFSTYSITACRIDCETRYLIENCNCRMVHMPGTSTVCTPEQYKDCADPALDFLVEKDNDYCVCETPCNMTRYGKELSMVKIPSKASAKYLAKKFNKTEQYIGENILVLDIFFEALNYEKIEQKKAYEIAGLLGDIGGQMGLFIGASVLTILEIFDYLYEVFKDKVLGNFLRKKRPQRCPSDNLNENCSLRPTACHKDRGTDLKLPAQVVQIGLPFWAEPGANADPGSGDTSSCTRSLGHKI
ncbi:acid-sensing ion channel 1C isoform X1 [Denticeps clupeoides]|uniref:acid-sensing ion channel 1C-like isoform X1 n=1 Tax=Denticeps clupeoides TaxID=299321 RepID=UPI0010A2D0D6|nr:acid-sensing ion channel 1C-like isoform X1 [Denticeps clupeoides]XP_028832646.1 acid-sensing ion channel 1C-like isoform X1 [Denticeps clupeoides]